MQQFKTTSLREKLQKYHGDKTDALFQAWAETWTDPSFADWEIAGLLPQIEARCLLLQGAADQYASQQHLFDIAKGIGAKAQAVLLENCGHTPHLQSPKETLDLMANFRLTMMVDINCMEFGLNQYFLVTDLCKVRRKLHIFLTTE